MKVELISVSVSTKFSWKDNKNLSQYENNKKPKYHLKLRINNVKY